MTFLISGKIQDDLLNSENLQVVIAQVRKELQVCHCAVIANLSELESAVHREI